jgi:transcriptional regulator with XRE-family HTH domain
MNYGAAITQLRRQAGLTKRELAKRIGCDESYICVLEAGRRRPSLFFVEKLTKELHLWPIQFFVAADRLGKRGR